MDLVITNKRDKNLFKSLSLDFKNIKLEQVNKMRILYLL